MVDRRDVVRMVLALPFIGFASARVTNGEKETLNASLTDAVLPNDSIVVR